MRRPRPADKYMKPIWIYCRSCGQWLREYRLKPTNEIYYCPHCGRKLSADRYDKDNFNRKVRVND